MIDIRYVKSPSSRRHIPTTHTPGNYVLLKSISSKNVSLFDNLQDGANCSSYNKT